MLMKHDSGLDVTLNNIHNFLKLHYLCLNHNKTPSRYSLLCLHLLIIKYHGIIMDFGYVSWKYYLSLMKYE